MTNAFKTIVVAAAISTAALTQAQALNTRTWISGTGVDQAGCGPIANPCRTLQYAHDNTSAGGEIDVKDSAGYGNVVINKAISIVGDGSLAGVLASAAGNAIEINAGASDLVILRGLTIEGAGIGSNGIVFNSAARLEITNCSVQNFVASGGGNGIRLQPAAGTFTVVIAQTLISNNGNNGIYYAALSSGAALDLLVDRVTMTNNGGSGLRVIGSGTGRTTVTNSIASKNGFSGFSTGTAANKLFFDSCVADFNVGSGYMLAFGNAGSIRRSHASGNTTYGISATSAMISFGDNSFSDNASGAVQGSLGTGTLN